MANTSRKSGNSRQVKSSNNLYKKGKLSKNARFNPKKINWTPLIVLACVLATFIFAVILGNALGEKAQGSQNTPSTTENPSNLTPPSTDKVSPYKNLHAYFADMTDADPEKSLSDQTAVARNRGNSLFISIKNNELAIAVIILPSIKTAMPINRDTLRPIISPNLPRTGAKAAVDIAIASAVHVVLL